MGLSYGGGAGGRIAARLGSRNRVAGDGTCNTDAYISVLSNQILKIDVWKAYRDGVWVSSVTIDVYADGETLVGAGLGAGPAFASPSACLINKTVNNSVANNKCTMGALWTITILDDGTISGV